jgi:hypothetical protein
MPTFAIIYGIYRNLFLLYPLPKSRGRDRERERERERGREGEMNKFQSI